MSSNHLVAVPPVWRRPIAQYEQLLRAAGRPKGTRYLRIYHLRRFAADHPESKPWEITEDQLIAWMARHKWAPETRRSYRASLKCFYSWGHAKGYIKADPSIVLPSVKVPPPRPRPAPDDVTDQALRAIDLRTRIANLILTMTGVRRHEAARMHTEDIVWIGDGWAVEVTGKGGRTRIIPVDDQFAGAIRALPAGYIFPGQIDDRDDHPGGHLSAAYLGKLVSASMPARWTAHTLRHRYASLAYSVEKDIRAVQELLGHAKITTTQIYTFVPQQSLRRAAGGARLGLTAA